MSYGFECWSGNGTLVLSSLTHYGILFAECYQVPAGAQSISRPYPSWTGRMGFAIVGCGPSYNQQEVTVSWTYPGGVPTLTITRTVPVGATSDPIPVYAFVK